MSDIDQFVKDYEGYVAVGGPKRLAEFLGGSQLQLVRDALEAEGELLTLQQLRGGSNDEVKMALFFCTGPHPMP